MLLGNKSYSVGKPVYLPFKCLYCTVYHITGDQRQIFIHLGQQGCSHGCCHLFILSTVSILWEKVPFIYNKLVLFSGVGPHLV